MTNLANVARTEFAAALNQIATERKIPRESILSAIEHALVSAYRKQFSPDEEMYYYAHVNEDTGESKIFRAPITDRDEETEEVLEWDETKSEDVTPAGFGRIAAQTAKQVILQKIRESEKEQIIADYSEKVGEIVSGQILRMDGRTVIIDIGRGQGYMPPEEQMRGEFYRMNARTTVLIKEIRETHRGQQIIVTRADEQLVAKLFEREVPEVASGAVEIVGVAREAGVRTKMAVRSTQEGVDPVGSCVGQRGVRVQEVIRELNNEKIDIIPYSEDLQLYLRAALAPAESLHIEVDEEKNKAIVTATDDQLSLAIGRGGQNVRLAAKLLQMKITVRSAAGAVESEATGDEEYEIDSVEGLTDETREFLIMRKLTTVNDLLRFRDKWEESDRLEDDQKQVLAQQIEERSAAEAELLSKRDKPTASPAEGEVAGENAEETAAEADEAVEVEAGSEVEAVAESVPEVKVEEAPAESEEKQE